MKLSSNWSSLPLPLWKRLDCLEIGDNLMLRQNHHWYKIKNMTFTMNNSTYELSNDITYDENELPQFFICKGLKFACIQNYQLIDYED